MLREGARGDGEDRDAEEKEKVEEEEEDKEEEGWGAPAPHTHMPTRSRADHSSSSTAHQNVQQTRVKRRGSQEEKRRTFFLRTLCLDIEMNCTRAQEPKEKCAVLERGGVIE